MHRFSPDMTASVSPDRSRWGVEPFLPFEKHRRIPSKTEKGFGKESVRSCLKSQENRRTETAGRQVSPQEGRWMCMVIIMNYPSFGSG
ncbi:hypothetical protein OHD62_10415 [Mesorhizobium sp. YC-39]|uniref:hypothetical protein n=1 Tax=Mesorhizobium sp. YC-39 TaxID=2986065 RepID=UPI0021E8153D|nr:hypothetical protein [Mesorhizobium sp. YC-39]MCV3228783.1 hypothetical protein [Mesorhizobium sp. YC-39]